MGYRISWSELGPTLSMPSPLHAMSTLTPNEIIVPLSHCACIVPPCPVGPMQILPSPLHILIILSSLPINLLPFKNRYVNLLYSRVTVCRGHGRESRLALLLCWEPHLGFTVFPCSVPPGTRDSTCRVSNSDGLLNEYVYASVYLAVKYNVCIWRFG